MMINTKQETRDSKHENSSKSKVYSLRFPRGQIMVVAIIFLAVILILAASLFGRVAGFLRFGSNSIIREQATQLAEAGVDKAIWQLNETAGAYSGETNTPLGTIGTFTVTVIPKTSSLKTLTATGYVPNSTSPRAKRTIKVDVKIDSESISFRFANQTGTGGVIMSNSATINGNIYSNGNISAGGGNQQTINGDAFAVGTIDSPPILVTGNKVPSASPEPLPTVDYDFWKNEANKNNDPITCSPTCTIDTSTSIGHKKYIGNLHLTNNAIITMTGPIHVTGNFSMSQGGTTLKLDESFGSSGTTLIVDGVVSLTQGGNFQTTSATPKGYILLVTTSISDQAITLSQTGATAIFYALEGGSELSQSANVASLVAKKLVMTQSATLTYETGLASAQFSTGPGGSWVVKKGTYRFTSSP